MKENNPMYNKETVDKVMLTRKQKYDSGELKIRELSNEEKYTDILSEEFSSNHITLKDNDLVKFPFLTYTIKLK